jgi:hypothetical protein
MITLSYFLAGAIIGAVSVAAGACFWFVFEAIILDAKD